MGQQVGQEACFIKETEKEGAKGGGEPRESELLLLFVRS